MACLVAAPLPTVALPSSSLWQVEPELLHLLVLLDVRRSGAAASEQGTITAAAQEGAPPVLRCSVADADAVPSPWERKAEAWRKAVTAALRPLHKELQALEASGTLPGYKASRLEQLQSDAAMLICNLQVGFQQAWRSCAGTLEPERPWALRTQAKAPAGSLCTLCTLRNLTFPMLCCRVSAPRAPPRTAVWACSLLPPPSTTRAAPTATLSPWVSRGAADASAVCRGNLKAAHSAAMLAAPALDLIMPASLPTLLQARPCTYARLWRCRLARS